MINEKLTRLTMKLGNKVRFKYGDNVITGTLTDKKGNDYLVDIDTINGEKQTSKTVITVTTATVLDYLFKNS